MDEEVDLTGAGGGLDAVCAVDEVARTGFHSEAVERVPAKRRLGALAEIGGHADVVGLERSLERGLELAPGIRSVKLGSADPDPRAAARRSGADVGCDACVGTERKPDQLRARRGPPREDAGALGNMRF
jgi:hypothetical protein